MHEQDDWAEASSAHAVGAWPPSSRHACPASIDPPCEQSRMLSHASAWSARHCLFLLHWRPTWCVLVDELQPASLHTSCTFLCPPAHVLAYVCVRARVSCERVMRRLFLVFPQGVGNSDWAKSCGHLATTIFQAPLLQSSRHPSPTRFWLIKQERSELSGYAAILRCFLWRLLTESFAVAVALKL